MVFYNMGEISEIETREGRKSEIGILFGLDRWGGGGT
jgi:hypothetical protein